MRTRQRWALAIFAVTGLAFIGALIGYITSKEMMFLYLAVLIPALGWVGVFMMRSEQ